jgi:hypothetical protein
MVQVRPYFVFTFIEEYFSIIITVLEFIVGSMLLLYIYLFVIMGRPNILDGPLIHGALAYYMHMRLGSSGEARANWRGVRVACGCIGIFCTGCIYGEILNIITVFINFVGCICTP